jgi:hypothetical protein
VTDQNSYQSREFLGRATRAATLTRPVEAENLGDSLRSFAAVHGPTVTPGSALPTPTVLHTSTRSCSPWRTTLGCQATVRQSLVTHRTPRNNCNSDLDGIKLTTLATCMAPTIPGNSATIYNVDDFEHRL